MAQQIFEPGDILKNVFSISDDELLPQEDQETMIDYIDRHMSVIHKIAERSREGYRRYSERCGMRSGGRYAVVDFVAAGTTQMHLENILPYKMKGYYFGTYNLNHTDCISNRIDIIHGCLHFNRTDTCFSVIKTFKPYVQTPPPEDEDGIGMLAPLE